MKNNSLQITRPWLFSFIFLLFPLVTFSQQGYFLTDSILNVGVKLVDGGDLQNMRICQVRDGDEIIEYSPYDIKEYGFPDGRIYVSREIQISGSSFRVFLRLLHKDQLKLYHYMGKGINTFFMEKNDSLFVELPRRDENNNSFRSLLSDLTDDCPEARDYSRLVMYSVPSLTRFAENYNACEFKTFSSLRYGFSFGTGVSRLKTLNPENMRLDYFNLRYVNNFSLGLFIESPMPTGNFSIQAELNFSRNNFSYYGSFENNNLDLLVNLTSVNLPVIIRYTHPSIKIRPFFNGGVFGNYYFQNETQHFETRIGYSQIQINKLDDHLFLKNEQIGYLIGAGLEYRFNFRRSLIFELRYFNPFEFKSSFSLGLSGFNLLTKINI
jgi:hypothetical protein